VGAAKGAQVIFLLVRRGSVAAVRRGGSLTRHEDFAIMQLGGREISFPISARPSMNVSLNLDGATARRLEEKAAGQGETVQAYLEKVAKNDAPAPVPDIPDEEFDRLLDELSADLVLPRLPDNLCRADVYLEHD
jgi:hypothetical protein